MDDDSATNLNALRQALGTTMRNNNNSTKAAPTKNKSTNTKDKDTTTVECQNQTANNQNVTATDRQQQNNQRAGTPPYMTHTTKPEPKPTEQQSQLALRSSKTSKSVEPRSLKTSSVSTSTTETSGKSTSSCTNEYHQQQCKKKRLYKSASSTEMLCAAGIKCKGYTNSKALVALGHFNKELLNSDDFDLMKDRYLEEEELLPNQIQHFLKHVITLRIKVLKYKLLFSAF